MSTFIYIVLGAIELLLTLRFILRFFSVSASAPVVAWIYGFTAPLIAPFSGIIGNVRLGNFLIEFTTLIALIAYAVIGYFLLWILSSLRSGFRKI